MLHLKNIQSLQGFVSSFGTVANLPSIELLDETELVSSATTNFNVILPYYDADSTILLFTSRNQASSFVFESNVVATEIAVVDNHRLSAYLIEPNTLSETDFDVTCTNAFNTYWCTSYQNVDKAALINSNINAIGNNTTSAIQIPTVGLDYIATGRELAFFVGGVNSSGIWTTTAETVFNTTTGNASMMVLAKTLEAGNIVSSYPDIDRGNDTVARLESSLAFVLQPTSNSEQLNLVSNGSFEFGSGLATDWNQEGSVVGTPTYSLSSTGVQGGKLSQRIQYSGQAGDVDTVFAIYQSPITAGPGDVLRAEVYISGALTSAYVLFGIESFKADTSYISEESVPITSVDGTPTKYTVEYTCPALTDYVALFIQFPEINDPSVVDVYFDSATLIKI